MEALECIKTRRSVRRFTEEPVTPEQVAEVVAAAAYAPTGCADDGDGTLWF